MGARRPQLLPNYDVFDERRYFRPGNRSSSLVLKNGLRLGLTICEDRVDTEPVRTTQWSRPCGRTDR